MIKLILISTLLITSCIPFSDKRTVKIQLNPKNSGWYFIQIIRDTAIKDTGVINVKFDDSIRFIKIKINSIEKTILSPYDYSGKSISSRLKFLGILEAKQKQFFEFYNPTDEELINVKKWMASDDRAMQIRLRAKVEFDKHYNERK